MTVNYPIYWRGWLQSQNPDQTEPLRGKQRHCPADDLENMVQNRLWGCPVRHLHGSNHCSSARRKMCWLTERSMGTVLLGWPQEDHEGYPEVNPPCWGPALPAAKPGRLLGTQRCRVPMETGFVHGQIPIPTSVIRERKTLHVEWIHPTDLLQHQCVLDSEGNESLAMCRRKAAGKGAGAGCWGWHPPLRRLRDVSCDSARRNGTAAWRARDTRSQRGRFRNSARRVVISSIFCTHVHTHIYIFCYPQGTCFPFHDLDAGPSPHRKPWRNHCENLTRENCCVVHFWVCWRTNYSEWNHQCEN